MFIIFYNVVVVTTTTKKEVIVVKDVSVTLSDRAHINLKSITQATKKNQSDVLTEILERIEVIEMVKELNKK